MFVVDEGNRVCFQIKDRFKETILNNFKIEKDQNFMHSTPSIVDVILPYSHRGTSGPGTVHHVAWQTPTHESQFDIRNRINKVGLKPLLLLIATTSIQCTLGSQETFYLK